MKDQGILVADSGGTQTDWCYVDSDGLRHTFRTASFHPTYFSDSFFDEFDEFWKERPALKKAKVYFYGAGCLQIANKLILGTYFNNWGFSSVSIFSDIEGACHSLLGNKPGLVAILGTGSVACFFDGNKITKIYGGLGYLLGDEGSGYYFGKLIVSKLLSNQIDKGSESKLVELLGDRQELLKRVYGENGKAFLSSLALELSRYDELNKLVSQIHCENIENFVSKVLPIVESGVESVCFAGSYAANNEMNLNDILKKYNYSLASIQQYPIEKLTEFRLQNMN